MRMDGAGRKEIIEAIRNVKGIISVKADMMREDEIWEFEIEAEEGVDVRRGINAVCRENNFNILMMKNNEMTLEDIFLKITMGESIGSNNNNNNNKKNKEKDGSAK
jgi:ABC-2 type transport system ATP-binding protein